MFTGIITDIGKLVSIQQKVAGERVFRISTAYNTGDIALGASICCSGICLTVTAKSDQGNSNWFEALVSKETLSATTALHWKEGEAINLERSLKVGDELGGHIVSGHVDCAAMITRLSPAGESWLLEAESPKQVAKYIASKGSIALEGVSLTVNSTQNAKFAVNIIPHTYENTNLRFKKPGDLLNLEIDIFARYVARLIEK